MIKSRIFLFLLLSFIMAIFLRSFFEIDNNFTLLLIIISIILLVTSYRNQLATLVAFILLVFTFGTWITNNKLQEAREGVLNEKIIQGNADVVKKTYSNFGQNLIIEFKKPKVKLLLRIPIYPEFDYGDVLKINCTAKIIKNKDTTFDYKMYMAKEGVFYSCENKKYEKISQKGGNLIMRNIIIIKNNFEKNLNQLIPAPEGVLAGGILFGGSDGLSQGIKNDFSRTGMTHIVAVSGYNVTIIAEYLILFGIFLGLWRKQAIWFALFGIALFVIMIGMPASAVRAGVMSGILLWAIKNGRLSSSENAVILAGAIMLMINPLLLRWDVGFQLSILATLGIVLSSPLWEKSFIKKHKAFGISEIIALSLSAQVFVLPIIAFNFGTVSLISLLANVLILPIVPLSMFLAFLTSLFGLIFPPLATLLAWMSYISLHYEIEIIGLLSKFPFASVEVADFNGWWIFAYYCILFMIITYLRKVPCQTGE